jgi:hypothetical protein
MQNNQSTGIFSSRRKGSYEKPGNGWIRIVERLPVEIRIDVIGTKTLGWEATVRMFDAKGRCGPIKGH